jgi:hypothetical protein
MFKIGIKEVVAVMAAAVALSWWLVRRAKPVQLADQRSEAAGWSLERHAAFASPTGRCAYEHFSKFRLN